MRAIGDLVSKFPAFGNFTALERLRPGESEATTFLELKEEITLLESAFIQMGIRKGDRVLLISETHKRRLACDLALLSIGTVVIPRGIGSTRKEIFHILRHSRTGYAIAENPEALSLLAGREFRESLKGAILLSGALPDSGGTKDRSSNFLLTYEEAIQRGKEFASLKGEKILKNRLNGIRSEDNATIVYTSGTTGSPKGVVLTHANICHNIQHCPIQFYPGERCLTILPPWHMMGRTSEFIVLSRGGTLVYTDPRRFSSDLVSMKPSSILGVPRLWEKIYENFFDKIHSKTGILRSASKVLLHLLGAYSRTLSIWKNEEPLRSRRFFQTLRALHFLLLSPILQPLQKRLHSKVQEVLGGSFRFGISGGGTLPKHVDEFFSSLGLLLFNGYGLTETSPILALRTPGNNVVGTVGRPLPETEIQIRSPEGSVLPAGETGMIWARGPQIMKGYYLSPFETEKVLNEKGWLNTGDLGVLSPKGNITITGRAKETIVLRGGENVEPAPIENAILQSPFIDQVMVVGQDQKFLGALVVPKWKIIEGHFSPAKVSLPSLREEMIQDGFLHRLIQKEIRNSISPGRGFKRHEAVVHFRILEDPFTQENGLLTRTYKMKRKEILNRYKHLVEEMFTCTEPATRGEAR